MPPLLAHLRKTAYSDRSRNCRMQSEGWNQGISKGVFKELGQPKAAAAAEETTQGTCQASCRVWLVGCPCQAYPR